ncbi:zinc ribbon domain-containing protein [Lacisediminihabitans sp.]|jgi:predicted  nucleic acid-binding Zn-ribbon protein|uniref:zinc ribbon domain-containing protein n=1 Tax=Lacisediminihabitans sp. TaxID=2787631 RepID=UPI002F938915
MPLKASPNDQAHLLELQAIDTRLQQLDHRAKTLPEIAVLAGLSSDADALRRELASSNGALEDARRELGRIESDVAVVEARIKRDTERLQGSSSVKDVAGFESELAGLRRRQLDLEEIELGVMERVEGLEAAAAELTGRHDELAVKIAAAAAEKDAVLEALTSERAHAAANRSTIAGKLPEELLALYERQRARYGFGASLLRGGVSSASGVKLNENDMAAIRSADPDEVLLCPDSSAILVRTAESGL